MSADPTVEEWLSWARTARDRARDAAAAHRQATEIADGARRAWEAASAENERCATMLARAIRDEGIVDTNRAVGVLWRPSFAEEKEPWEP